MLVEKYRMALNRDKYENEVWNDYAINLNRILFDVIQRTCSFLDGLYMDEKCLLIDTIKKINQVSRLQNKLKYWKEKKRTLKKEGTSKTSPKKAVLRIKQPKKV